MKLHKIFRNLLLIAWVLATAEALAYSDDKEKEICRQPKIQEFTLPEYSDANKKEAAPEAEFSFVVSGWANPKKFKLEGKGVSIPFTVQSNETFHKVKAKLPAEFTGKAVRISARIPALLGCYSTIGWLVKVADKAAPVEAAKPAEAAAPAATGTPSTTPPAEQNKSASPEPSATKPPKAEGNGQNIQDVQ